MNAFDRHTPPALDAHCWTWRRAADAQGASVCSSASMPVCVVQGAYFADDAGKIDQYVKADAAHNASSPLHQVLKRSGLKLCFRVPQLHKSNAVSRVRRCSNMFVSYMLCCAAAVQRQQASWQRFLRVCFQVCATAPASFPAPARDL